MKRKTRIVLWAIVVGFALYAVLTAGLAIEDSNDFGGQRPIVLADGLQSDVCIDPEMTKFDIPFVFHYFSTGKPFGLSLQIWDRSKEYRTIEITEVLVEYWDGEVIRKTDPWVRHLRPYTAYYSSSSGGSQTDMFMLSDQIPELVLRHADVKITLTGHLIKTDGQRVVFKTSEMFKATSLWRIATYWQVIGSC